MTTKVDISELSSSAAQRQRAVPVFVLTEERSQAEAWSAMLEGPRFEVHTRLAAFTANHLPDVIVTDCTLATEDLADFHELMIRGEIGVILIGQAFPADVQLPRDVSRRELRIACRMLAQVVGLRRQNRQLARLAATDPLTGLPNRRALEEHVEAQANGSLHKLVALAVFDLDQFKRINREFGFAFGDNVLKSAAKTLGARRGASFVARLGGDEFVMVWPVTCESAAMEQADQCRRAIGIAAGLAAERPLSASAGVACMPSGTTLQSLLATADEALLRAKEAGGKQCQ
jgi:diguanylate cyclase (GGDEF)-like protein